MGNSSTLSNYTFEFLFSALITVLTKMWLSDSCLYFTGEYRIVNRQIQYSFLYAVMISILYTGGRSEEERLTVLRDVKILFRVDDA